MVWWMSGVVDVWCGGCPIIPMVWWMSGVMDILFNPWCGGCLVWWMSVWWMSYNQISLSVTRPNSLSFTAHNYPFSH